MFMKRYLVIMCNLQLLGGGQYLTEVEVENPGNEDMQ